MEKAITTAQVKFEKDEVTQSKILNNIIHKVTVEREAAANWSQNWNAHTNHSNNSDKRQQLFSTNLLIAE